MKTKITFLYDRRENGRLKAMTIYFTLGLQVGAFHKGLSKINDRSQ